MDGCIYMGRILEKLVILTKKISVRGWALHDKKKNLNIFNI